MWDAAFPLTAKNMVRHQYLSDVRAANEERRFVRGNTLTFSSLPGVKSIHEVKPPGLASTLFKTIDNVFDEYFVDWFWVDPIPTTGTKGFSAWEESTLLAEIGDPFVIEPEADLPKTLMAIAYFNQQRNLLNQLVLAPWGIGNVNRIPSPTSVNYVGPFDRERRTVTVNFNTSWSQTYTDAMAAWASAPWVAGTTGSFSPQGFSTKDGGNAKLTLERNRMIAHVNNSALTFQNSSTYWNFRVRADAVSGPDIFTFDNTDDTDLVLNRQYTWEITGSSAAAARSSTLKAGDFDAAPPEGPDPSGSEAQLNGWHRHLIAKNNKPLFKWDIAGGFSFV